MLWLGTALSAYFLWAITNVIDKKLLSDKIPNSFVYAIASSILLFFETLLLVPFVEVSIPSSHTALIIIGGMSFIYALVLYFWALSKGDASSVVSITAFSAVFTLLFSHQWFGQSLTNAQLLAFLVLIIGGFFVSQKGKSDSRASYLGIAIALGASVVYGLSYAIQGEVFLNAPFWSSFIGMRVAGVFATVTLLFIPAFRDGLKHAWQHTSTKVKSIFAANQLLALVAFLFLSFSFSLASASLVNALQGAQYMFLFILVLTLTRWWPKTFKEELTTALIVKKVIGIVLITVGIGILSLA